MRWFLEGQGDNIKIYYLKTPLESVGNRNIFPLAADSSAYQLCPNKQRDFFLDICFISFLAFSSVHTVSSCSVNNGVYEPGSIQIPVECFRHGCLPPCQLTRQQRLKGASCQCAGSTAKQQPWRAVNLSSTRRGSLPDCLKEYFPHNPRHSLLAINSYCFLDFCFKNHLRPQVGRHFL